MNKIDNKKYKIAYITSSRADYGIVRRYLKLLENDETVDLSILVTGTHLEEKYGMTIKEIISDGLNIKFEAKIDIDSTNNKTVIDSMSKCLQKFGDFFQENKYDLIIVLGDRYEMLAATIAAAMNGMSILHLHGGEITAGNYDEFIRHSITKMSKFHFTSTKEYKKRVIQLGEDPKNVFYMGALGAENCKKIDESLIKNEIKYFSNERYFLIAFHPETLNDKEDVSSQIDEILSAISKIESGYKYILLGTNADTKSDIIRNKWIEFSKRNDNVYYFENLNSDSYLFLLKNAIAIIGNSSAGIIEAPTLKTYTINIGNRQEGRVQGNSIINTSCLSEDIYKAICKTIELHLTNYNFINPYFKENSAQNYYKKTKKILSKNDTSPKKFYDLQYELNLK